MFSSLTPSNSHGNKTSLRASSRLGCISLTQRTERDFITSIRRGNTMFLAAWLWSVLKASYHGLYLTILCPLCSLNSTLFLNILISLRKSFFFPSGFEVKVKNTFHPVLIEVNSARSHLVCVGFLG